MLLSRERILSRQRISFATTVVAALLAWGLFSPEGSLSSAFGQSRDSLNAATHGVAVVDISYIFKNHARFRNSMDSMKKEMDAIEVNLKAKRDQIAKIEEERNKYNVGNEQYKKFDEQLAREMANFNLEMTKLRKDFLDREAKEYYKTYLEIVDAVTKYAQTRNIGLVIRFNGDPVDPNRREDVLREINKPVVYQNQIDITPDVLQSLNRDVVATGPGQPQRGLPQPGMVPPGQPIQPQAGQPRPGQLTPGQVMPGGGSMIPPR
jgi:Skp family chaperone for outer membrane proteins